MFRKIKKNLWLFATLLTCILGGCATNAHINQMVVHNMANQKPMNSLLVHGITVGEVSGGHETNPLWSSKINNENFKGALEQSLQEVNLFHQYKNSSYVLNAHLVSLHQPLVGFNFTVTAEINYVLQNMTTQKIVFNKNIVTSYTAKFDNAFLGVTRLRMADEGAARANIRKLITNLYQLPQK